MESYKPLAPYVKVIHSSVSKQHYVVMMCYMVTTDKTGHAITKYCIDNKVLNNLKDACSGIFRQSKFAQVLHTTQSSNNAASLCNLKPRQ